MSKWKRCVVAPVSGVLMAALGLIAVAQPLAAPAAHEAPLPVAALLEDFDTLHRIVEESHPHPYRLAAAADVEQAWRARRADITAPMARRDFANLLEPLLAQYRDGHTYLDPLESPDYKAYAAAGGRFFPFELTAIDGQVYVAGSRGALRLPAGTLVERIDGRPTARVLEALAAGTSGDSDDNRRASALRLFPLLLWQQDRHGDSFALDVRLPGGARTQALRAAGITRAQLEDGLFGMPAVAAYELSPQVFVLALNKMQSTDAVKAQVDAALATLRRKRYPVFVIDIRRDGGGNSVVGDWVLEHLTRAPIRHADRKEVRLSPWLVEHNAYFRQWTTRLMASATVQGDRIVEEARDDDTAPDPERWIYGGQVYLLTSPRTYSSAFMMAEAFKCQRLGTLAGEPPGSHRNLTGELMQFKLPHSGIVGYVATAQYFPPCFRRAPTDFLAPDLPLAQTIDDLVAGRDTALEAIRARVGREASAGRDAAVPPHGG